MTWNSPGETIPVKKIVFGKRCENSISVPSFVSIANSVVVPKKVPQEEKHHHLPIQSHVKKGISFADITKKEEKEEEEEEEERSNATFFSDDSSYSSFWGMAYQDDEISQNQMIPSLTFVSEPPGLTGVSEIQAPPPPMIQDILDTLDEEEEEEEDEEDNYEKVQIKNALNDLLKIAEKCEKDFKTKEAKTIAFKKLYTCIGFINDLVKKNI